MCLLKWNLDLINKTKLKTCGFGKKADFWIVTNYVNLNTTFADVIHVDVEAELTSCLYPVSGGTYINTPCYANYFEVYIYRGTDDDKVYRPKPVPRSTDLDILLKVYSPLYNITNNTKTSPHATLTGRSIQTFSFPQNNSQGVAFAIRSTGACGSIYRMKMHYYYCEETFINGIKFEETASPAKGFKNVTGNCSEYAISLINGTASFHRYCYENGNWSVLEDENLKCFCIEGHSPNKIDESCSSK